jgi:hypothetical protein
VVQIQPNRLVGVLGDHEEEMPIERYALPGTPAVQMYTLTHFPFCGYATWHRMTLACIDLMTKSLASAPVLLCAIAIDFRRSDTRPRRFFSQYFRAAGWLYLEMRVGWLRAHTINPSSFGMPRICLRCDIAAQLPPFTLFLMSMSLLCMLLRSRGR